MKKVEISMKRTVMDKPSKSTHTIICILLFVLLGFWIGIQRPNYDIVSKNDSDKK